MKKLFTLVMIAMMFGFASNVVAYDGDFEISGHVNTGFGYQYNGAKWSSVGLGAFTEEGMVPIRAGSQAIATANSKNDANSLAIAYVGDIELDVTKTFGENIRLRADLDFVRQNSYGYGSDVQFGAGNYMSDRLVEQAYATINIPVGYGLEFLVGRFNAPIGFEAYDNNDNDLPFHTYIFNYLRPQNLTGIKFYYPFSDLIDLHFWIANNLRDVAIGGLGGTGIQTGKLPAFGGRLGFTWGMEGQESTIGVSGGASSEAKALPGAGAVGTAGPDKWGMWSYFGDLDFNIWVNDVFAIGGEGFYRRDGAPSSSKGLAGGRNSLYFAGLLNLHYLFSDVWDGTLRYTYANDYRGTALLFGVFPTGYRGAATLNGQPGASQFHRFAGSAMVWDAMFNQVDLGINYHVTDGAKIMMMYRFDLAKPKPVFGGAATAYITKMSMAHTVAANFAYEF